MATASTSLSKIKANSLNLAGTYGFSGTVTGFDDTPLVLLSTFTSDGSDATASFTSGIDSTYKEYMFVFNNIHPQTDYATLLFNGSTDGGSNYNVTKTTTFFQAYHDEGDSATTLDYTTTTDLAQSTAFQNLGYGLGNDNDENASGILKLYNPSSTTHVKHFVSRINMNEYSGFSVDYNVAGYLNTTSAIDAIQFKMSSGEIQGGTIDLFGVV
jgi:hypothetical protein